MFKRILLFVITNIVVILTITIVLSIIEQFFGISLSGNGGMVSIIIFSSVVGFVGAFISLAMSKSMAKSTYNIQIMKYESDSWSSHHGPKLKAVYTLVQQIAYNNTITMPEVWYYESQEVNAFATGMSKNSSLVAVSSGLLEKMTIEEIEWVVWHEMAHILNGDMITSTLLQWILNTFVVAIARIVAWIIASRDSDEEDGSATSWWTYYIVMSVMEMVLWIGAMTIQMWYSRQREFAADRGWAYFTSKEKMIAWLRRLQHIDPTSTVSDNYATFKIFGWKSMMSLFQSHPPLEERIRKLEEANMSVL